MEFLAPFHPQITHAPIVLLIAGFVFEVAGLALDRDWLRKSASVLLVLGVASAVAAVLSGRAAADRALDQGVSDLEIQYHERMAYLTLFYALGALLLRGVAALTPRARRRIAAVSFVAWLIACVCVGITAHRGASLVFKHGAAVHLVGERPGPR